MTRQLLSSAHDDSFRLRQPRLFVEALEDRSAPSDLGLGAAALPWWTPALAGLDPLAAPAPAATRSWDREALPPASERSAALGQNVAPARVHALHSILPDVASRAAVEAPDHGDTLLRAASRGGPASTLSTLATTLWTDRSYAAAFTQSWYAQGRIGNTLVPAGTFELDIGPNSARPAATADYRWTAFPEAHPFLVYYFPGVPATFLNNGVELQYTPTWTGDPATDTLFLRTFALHNQSALFVLGLYLYTPALGDFVPVPNPDGSGGPASVGTIGPDQQVILQLHGTPLQNGFVLFGQSYWFYATTGADVPRNSQLAFQVEVGNRPV